MEEVFSYVADRSHLATIWPSLIAIKDVKSLPSGGSAFKYIYKMAGWRLEGTGSDSEYVAKERIVTLLIGDLEGTITFRFEAISPKQTKAHLAVAYTVPEKAVQRIRAATVRQDVKRSNRPHQRVFKAKLVPEIFPDPPTLDIRHQQEKHDRQGSKPREQSKSNQRSANELGRGYCWGPDLARAISLFVQVVGKHPQGLQRLPCVGKKSKRHAQPVRDERQPDTDTQ